MSQKLEKSNLGQKIMKVAEIIMTISFVIILTIALAFFYEDIGYISSVTIIIVAGAILLPRFLRRNFGTDEMKDIGGVYHQEKIGSFLLTSSDETSFYPYREFNAILCIISPIKYSRKQHLSKIYYIDFKTKCLILLVQIILFGAFIIGLSAISKIEDNKLSLMMILILTIMFFQFFSIIRNYLIKKLAKNFNQ